QWDFGDGNTSTQQNPEHTYQNAGSYTVGLTVTADVDYVGYDSEIKTNYIIVSSGGEPCPGLETVSWQDQTYNTVLIGEQCWFKENLNYETGNSWCYDNDPANCDTYGRLYDWETALGVCPDGWLLPSDNEWKILEGTVDSQYAVGDPEWDRTGWRGHDAGKKLKSASGWYNNGNGTDIYGFGAFPGGLGVVSPSSGLFLFLSLGSNSYWWSSSEASGTDAWSRDLFFRHHDDSYRFNNLKTFSLSVRCLRDN
ncbi:MAG: PKD domain-containing protein, partial [Gammaproteobacteria bacterium]|nr:PKD domain-containing protein [Gammaproteobacteria bacterium]